MRYLEKGPFPSKPTTDAYRDNYDRIFGKKKKSKKKEPLEPKKNKGSK